MDPVPVLIVFLVGFVVWAATTARRIDDGQVHAVARMYSLPLSPPVIERLRRRLLLVRRWRLAGALAGAGVGVLTTAVTTIELSVNVLLFSIAMGFALSAATFELIDARRARSPHRAVATTRPRTIGGTVSWVAFAPCGLTIVLVAGSLVISAIWSPQQRIGVVAEPLDRWLLAVLAGMFVAVVASAVVAIGMVVQASERGTDQADVIVRRATRLSAMMTIVGATWMSVGLIGVVVVQPLWDAAIGNGLVSALRMLAVLYVGLSPMMGFIATVTALPRRGPRQRGDHPDTSGVRPIGEMR